MSNINPGHLTLWTLTGRCICAASPNCAVKTSTWSFQAWTGVSGGTQSLSRPISPTIDVGSSSRWERNLSSHDPDWISTRCANQGWIPYAATTDSEFRRREAQTSQGRLERVLLLLASCEPSRIAASVGATIMGTTPPGLEKGGGFCLSTQELPGETLAAAQVTYHTTYNTYSTAPIL